MRENWRELNLTAVTEQQQQLNSPRIHSFIDKPESKSQVPKSNGKGKGEFGLLAVCKISWPINYDKYDYQDGQDED